MVGELFTGLYRLCQPLTNNTHAQRALIIMVTRFFAFTSESAMPVIMVYVRLCYYRFDVSPLEHFMRRYAFDIKRLATYILAEAGTFRRFWNLGIAADGLNAMLRRAMLPIFKMPIADYRYERR